MKQVGVDPRMVQPPDNMNVPALPRELQSEMARAGKIVQISQKLLEVAVGHSGLVERPNVDPVARAYSLAFNFVEAADHVLAPVEEKIAEYLKMADGVEEGDPSG